MRTAIEAASGALELLRSFESEVLVKSADFEVGVDFYDLVQDFESNLIKRALRHANGIQKQAARMLHIRPTTLNNKIKMYDIQKEFCSIAEAPTSTKTRSLKKKRDNLVA